MIPLTKNQIHRMVWIAACVLCAIVHVSETRGEEDPWGLSENAHRRSRLSGEAIPLQLEGFPARPSPLLEIGENFLGSGNLQDGFELPTGAVWQPYFIVFGNLRTAVQTFGRSKSPSQEWMNRLDLFGNLYLTFTERILVGIRPLDQRGQFVGYTIRAPGIPARFNDDPLNFDVTTLFFEGDLGELWPNLDLKDANGLDIGVSVGRQPISFQDGMLINDNIDAAGITKINMKWFGAINFRWTLLYGWNKINRSIVTNNLAVSNPEDGDAQLLALFTETDTRNSTIAFDVIYVDADQRTGKSVHAGLSSVQRYGGLNSTFRILGSLPIGDETVLNTRGLLLFTEFAWTPVRTHNYMYISLFAGVDKFRSAARDPGVAGPLAPQAGILFAGAGLGRYGAPLNNLPDNAVGGAWGYQVFSKSFRQNIIFELGGRYGYKKTGQTAVAFGLSAQAAWTRYLVFRVDGGITYILKENDLTPGDKVGYGARFEILAQI